MASSSLLLFGPVSPRPVEASVVELRKALRGNPDFQFLVDVLEELPSLRQAVQKVLPHTSTLREHEQVEQLKWLATMNLPEDYELSNVVSAPLTVISQIVEYLRSSPTAGSAQFPYFENVQGFCIGFLSAAALAVSKDKEDFRHFASVAVRLAMCIGLIIDLDEESFSDPLDGSSSMVVWWKSFSMKGIVEKTLKDYPGAYVSCFADDRKVTVTAPSRFGASLTQVLLEHGLSVQFIGLRGRYHHSTNIEAVRLLKGFCNADKRLQLPSADRLVLPLRSNADAKLLTGGALHEIAFESILTLPSQWHSTIKAVVTDMSEQSIDVKTIGPESILPRSIATTVSRYSSLPERSGENFAVFCGDSDGIANELGTPAHSSTYPTPPTESESGAEDPADNTSAIAVVGMACRFPNADSLDQYWQLICSGQTAVRQVPQDRFDQREVEREPKGPFWGNFLSDADAFDHRFFSIAAREAKSMDPQQRLLLQVVYEAIESTGYYGPLQEDRSDRVGCFIGVGSVDYEDNVACENATAFSALGTLRAFISGRISHHFGWSGPSITYDTACSSSAVAIHSACKALQTGECSMAVAGGVNIMTSPKLFQNLAAGGFLNLSGASRAFDAEANGYCRGEGSGVVVLKPLGQAVADSSPILGVIAGSAVNQGSNCTPITVPVTESQSALYQQALSMTSLDPHDISYVEAHGTGTPVGDPIECKSIRQVFGGASRSHDLFLGSVKDNIGHAEAASGVAALIKTILMIQNSTIPRQANFISLNPSIPPLEPDRMIIPKETRSWDSRLRSAVVNNYGAAGSNAAIVLQEYCPAGGQIEARRTTSTSGDVAEFPFYISAKSLEQLNAYRSALGSYLTRAQKTVGATMLPSIAYNLATRQNRSFECSWSFTSQNHSDLLEQLQHSRVEFTDLNQSLGDRRPIMLCFGGQTGRHVSLSEELFNDCRLLQTHLIQCDSVCKRQGLPSIFPGLFSLQPVDDIVELHCRLFCLQYSCAKSWLDCGLEVDTMVGHSFGQLTALCVAGAYSLDDGIRLISTRARLIRDQWGPENGAMLAVEGSRHDVEALMRLTKAQRPGYSAEISCFNGPRSFVLAGDTDSIDAIEEVSKVEQFPILLKLKRLSNTHAYHSHLVESILPGLDEVARSIHYSKPLIPVETCSRNHSSFTIDANDIVRHSREPVHFAAAVERISARYDSSLWIEAGSGSPIIAMTRRIIHTDSRTKDLLLPIDLANAKAQNNLARASSEVWRAGSKSQYWLFHPCQKQSYSWLSLPPYPFEKTRHWIDYKAPSNPSSEKTSVPESRKPELLRKMKDDSNTALFLIDPSHNVFRLCTKGHSVVNQSLCPASLYLELAVKAIRDLAETQNSSSSPCIQALKMSSPLSLGLAGQVFLQLTRDRSHDESYNFTLFSHSQSDPTTACTHASGIVTLIARDDRGTESRLQSLNRLIGNTRCDSIMNASTANGLNGAIVYKNFARVVDYATFYRGVQRIFAKDYETVGYVCVPEDQPLELNQNCCDPIALDNFLQVSGIHVNCLWDCKDDEVFVCTAIREIIFSEQFMDRTKAQRSWTVYSNFTVSSNEKVVNDIFVLQSESGNLVVTMMGAEFTRLPLKSLSRTLSKLSGSQRQDQLEIKSGQNQMVPAPNQKHRETECTQDAVDQEDLADVPEVNQDQILGKVQRMLSEILEVSVEDINLDSTLDDLGVDSLMATEVINEIQTRFGIPISNAEFQGLIDLRSLGRRLQLLEPKKGSSNRQQLPMVQSINDAQVLSNVGTLDTSIAMKTNDQPNSSLADTVHGSFTDIKRTFDMAANDTKFVGFCRDVYPAQKQLVTKYVVDAFAALGCHLASLTPGQPLSDIHHSTKYTKVVRQFYKVLEDAGIITRSATKSYRTDIKVPSSSAKTLSDAIIDKYPQHSSEHKLLHVTGSQLAGCLSEKADPIALLFGNAASRALMTDVYTNAPMFKAGTIVLGNYIAKIFDQIDEDQEVRILELGAGTGGTTSSIIESLSRYKRKFEYTFTDLSSSLVTAAKKRFAHYEFMRYATLDIEQKPPALHLGQYDIVISTNCIHATRNLTTSTGNIRSMLREDGILCLVELTQNLFWFDLVFGLLDGWWLFIDGREHVLANEVLWEQSLRRAGFQWIDWTDGDSKESQILRVIAASPSKASPAIRQQRSEVLAERFEDRETVLFKEDSNPQLLADVYYPDSPEDSNTARPIALMIHGGGHVMLSREDIRPQQTKFLLEAGFLPVSIDYRLCPETTLPQGPMSDICSALHWARNTHPTLRLRRHDIHPDGNRVVAVGWSTGGHLAMTLAWTAPAMGLAPPNAILAFYCPSDYEDLCWSQPNMPRGAAADLQYDLYEGVQPSPLTAYNPPVSAHALGGWLAPEDPRSRICLHMNWKGQTLPVLLRGLDPANRFASYSPPPTEEEIQAISPLAQIKKGTYRTPTFIVHGTEDDLIPWQQARRTHEVLCERGVEAQLRVVEGGIHLFDLGRTYERNEGAARAVREGYEFLGKFTGDAR